MLDGVTPLRCGQTKRRGPFRVRAFVPIVAWGLAGGLGDDLGSLQEGRDGDRSKQNESGGEGNDLGHVEFP